MSEAAQQPRRGVGNLNLNRFDRTEAIEAVATWATALHELDKSVRDFEATCGWNQMGSIADIEGAVQLAGTIPSPELGIDEAVIALAANGDARQRLSVWADMALRAHELETEVTAVCIPVGLNMLNVSHLTE